MVLGLARQDELQFAPLVTHPYCLDETAEAYRFFGEGRDEVTKVTVWRQILSGSVPKARAEGDRPPALVSSGESSAGRIACQLP
jgi:hypothetical protein